MKYQDIGFSSLEPVYFEKMETMGENRDVNKMLATLDARGIIELNTHNTNWTTVAGGPSSYDKVDSTGAGWTPEVNITIPRNRVIAVNFFLYSITVVTGVPEPRFAVFVDDVQATAPGNFWTASISPGENRAGSVRLRCLFAGKYSLPSGDTKINIKMKNNHVSSTDTFTLQSGPSSTPEAKLWVEDLGSNRIWRPTVYV